MFSCAVPRNCRSVAEQVWSTAALLFPPMRRAEELTATIATASPAAAVMRGFTFPSSAATGEASSPVRVRAMPCDIRGELLSGPAEDPERKSEPEEANQKISDRYEP